METQTPARVPADVPADKIKAVNGLHKRFVSAMRKGALLAFEAGKILKELREGLEAADSWPDFCRENPAFDAGTANRYLRVYKNFKDNPKALTGQTVTGTLKLLSAPREEPPGEEEGGEPEGVQPELPWERYFELPPLSREAKLKNYRFDIIGGHEVYLIRRGFSYPIKIAEVLAAEDKRLKTAHRGMLENVQAALELYYQEVERIEGLEVKE
jgi:hypothetical protein